MAGDPGSVCEATESPPGSGWEDRPWTQLRPPFLERLRPPLPHPPGAQKARVAAVDEAKEGVGNEVREVRGAQIVQDLVAFTLCYRVRNLIWIVSLTPA